MNVAGLRVAVLGLGVAGEACARALLGVDAHVTVIDAVDGEAQRARGVRLSGAMVVLGEDAPDLAGFDLAVVSPGIAPGSGLWKAAHGAAEVIGEVELAYRLGVRPVAAVTGTNGKTTVTEMLTACLVAAGREAVAVGNIGAPITEAHGDAIVAEVSSFHLETIDRFAAPVGILMNVAHDHLDWHGTFAAYRAAKARIAQVATDRLIVHRSCADLAVGARCPVTVFDLGEPAFGGAGVVDDVIVVPEGSVMPVGDLRMRRNVIVEDAIAAAAAACALGADPADAARALAAYTPGRHRMEDAGEAGGVRFIDDSKATDPHAALAAIAEFPDAVLIAGGRNRSRDLRALRDAAPTLRAVIALGEAAHELLEVFAGTGVPTEEASGMDDAVRRAYARARPDGMVLLSPACASLDMFTSYAARGEAFVAAIRSIREATV